MKINEVTGRKSIYEAADTIAELTQLRDQATDPQLKKHYQWRIDYEAAARKPENYGNASWHKAPPTEPDPAKWIQKNPSLVQQMAADGALPPGITAPPTAFQQGVDTVKGMFGMKEAQVDVKPATGAMEVAVDGKPFGMAKDQQTADAIKGMASSGDFTPVNTDPNAAKTMEETHDEDENPSMHHFHHWMNSEHAPHDDDSGDDHAVFNKALHYLDGREHPGNMEFHAHNMAKLFHGAFDESHHDTIAQGGGDIGGDAGDAFINDIIDQKFTRAQRDGSGQRSAISENDELQKWLTIAGIK
jgi:hypothetical protein